MVNSEHPSHQQIISLLELYQSGRLDDAEKLAVSLTRDFPRHPFGWKALGAVLKSTGKKSEAVDANRTAVTLSPQDAETHSNLGVTLQELGRLEEAEASYRKAIALNPGYAEAHSNLGNILKELGGLDEAKASYNKAIALKPDYAEAHYNLGVTQQELGRLERAKTSYNKAIALNPNFAEAHYNLGNIHKELGILEEAKASYNKVIALSPNYAEAHNNLGATLKGLRKLDEAEASIRQAITLKPDYAEAHGNLGATLKGLGRWEEAETSYNKAIELKPEYAEAHSNLGNMHKELGRINEAKESYNKAIALKPDYAEAHRMLASIKKFDSNDAQYSKMLELYFDKNISDEKRCHINFGLAKAYDDLGDFEKAFTHYKEGNALRKKLLNYNIKQDLELFRQIKSAYQWIEQYSLESEQFSKNLTPIFIIGMPRSGTTIVEQIISSHSLVTGAGELPYAAQFGSVIANGFSKVDREVLLDFRHKYLEKLKKHSFRKGVVTDKMPQNFRYIGLLAAAFPEAKIIHVKRNPAAVCWANYKQYFASKNQGYCYDLDDVVSYHNLYVDLMKFWTKILNKRIYNLDYEALTKDQEDETRQLIDHLDLNWDKKCLSPENNKRRVLTASNLQVREKLYQGSSQQWKNYQPFLNGAFDILL